MAGLQHLGFSQAVEAHSEEVERAIWRMHQKEQGAKEIARKLQDCEINVSLKFVKASIRRATYTALANAEQTRGPLHLTVPASAMEELVEEQPVIEEMNSSDDNAEVDLVSAADNATHSQQEVIEEAETIDHDHAEITTIKSEAPEYLSYHSKKPRRIKTTDELIRKIEEDFALYPELKVKERAAKFGIAVGTLCQIKHNVLKMPKESGRTWKSTPAMVEAVKADIEADPNVKVKERAEKFNISVGTLCRIMHDMLQRPKRTVNRSATRRSSRRSQPPRETLAAKISKNRVLEHFDQNDSSMDELQMDGSPPPSMLNLSRDAAEKERGCQLHLKGPGENQVLVLTFDSTSQTAQLTSMNTATAANAEEVIWVVNPSSPPHDGNPSSELSK